MATRSTFPRWTRRCGEHRTPDIAAADAGQDHIVAGFAGVLIGEHHTLGAAGPLSQALTDLVWHYADTTSRSVPVHLARRHHGAPGPAWLLPTMVRERDHARVLAEVLELALEAGAQRHALADCIAYLELAELARAGQHVATAPPASIPLCGEVFTDAVFAGRWALQTNADVPTVLCRLERHTTPAVTAAVCGLVGLRHGTPALPPDWNQRPGLEALTRRVPDALVDEDRFPPAAPHSPRPLVAQA